MPSLGVRPDQHEMIDLPLRTTKPNRNMHGTGQVCRHQTVGGPAGSRDLSAGRLVTKLGGRDGSHTNYRAQTPGTLIPTSAATAVIVSP